jgi:GDP-4-dehydro-6-deoxy-D-mannose reductase
VLSKAASDTIAETCGRLWGLDVVRTRSFGHVGAGQSTRFMLPSWCRQIAEIEAGSREPVLRVGNLAITRDLTDVRDVVDAYLSLLERGRPATAYNVCRGEGARLDEIVDSLCRRARVPVRIETDESRLRVTDIPYLVGDPTRILEDTGWRVTIPLDRTLDETLEEWRRRVAAEPVS